MGRCHALEGNLYQVDNARILPALWHFLPHFYTRASTSFSLCCTESGTKYGSENQQRLWPWKPKMGVDIGALSNRIFSGSFPRATSLRSAGLVCQNTQKRNGIVGNALHQEWNQSGNPSPIFIASRRKLEETLETIFRGASPSKVGNIIFALPL